MWTVYSVKPERRRAYPTYVMRLFCFMNIKDYLHLYLGANYDAGNGIDVININTLAYLNEFPSAWERIKPILRQLSDMTEEEHKEHESLQTNYGEVGCGCIGTLIVDNGKSIVYLLSKHFDLFGLIEAGLAIDKTKIKEAV